MAKEKHLAVVEVGAVVKLAKGLTSSYLIVPMRVMLIVILIFFVKYPWILFLGDEVQHPPPGRGGSSFWRTVGSWLGYRCQSATSWEGWHWAGRQASCSSDDRRGG